MKTIKGSCHCQAIQFEIATDITALTTCDCSICARKNALMVKVHETSMTITAGEDFLNTYHFNTKTAMHYFCKA